MISVSPDPIDPGTLLAGFLQGREDSGGVVNFTGLVRPDEGVEALELEAYPGFTEAAIAEIVEHARQRFSLDDALVAHRIGRIVPGEVVVFVATAARHRRGAFDAADFLMDYLKSRAPLWKRSHEADGAHWVEPTNRDHADLSRWSRDP